MAWYWEVNWFRKKCACWHFGEHNIQTVGISISTDNDFISKKSNVYKLKYKREKKNISLFRVTQGEQYWQLFKLLLSILRWDMFHVKLSSIFRQLCSLSISFLPVFHRWHWCGVLKLIWFDLFVLHFNSPAHQLWKRGRFKSLNQNKAQRSRHDSVKLNFSRVSSS